MSGKIEEYLSERKSAAVGKNAEYWREFEDLHQRKLWHNLTVLIKKALSDADFASKENLPLLYERFIKDFEHRINQLALVQVGLMIAGSFEDKNEGAKFLEKLSSSISTGKSATASYNVEASLLCQTGIADLKLDVRDPRTNRCIAINDVKTILEEAAKKLDTLEHVLPEVHGEYYRVSSKYLRDIGDYSAYYREALRYLGCVDVEKVMSVQERQFQAKCLGLAALLGDDIYNIGELLAHPVLKALNLQGGEKWLADLLYAFNSGNIKKFEELRPVWSKNDDLKRESALLERKIRLLSLMEMAFVRPSKDRQIQFKEIAEVSKVDVNEVELLVMKAFALGLIKGYIDEVEKIVVIHWVQPRVLDREQIGTVAQRFGEWSNTVKNIESLVESHAGDILTHG